jgi:hypothetical protein
VLPPEEEGEGEDAAVIGKQVKTINSKTETGMNFRGILLLIPISRRLLLEKLFKFYRKKFRA